MLCWPLSWLLIVDYDSIELRRYVSALARYTLPIRRARLQPLYAHSFREALLPALQSSSAPRLLIAGTLSATSLSRAMVNDDRMSRPRALKMPPPDTGRIQMRRAPKQTRQNSYNIITIQSSLAITRYNESYAAAVEERYRC